MKSFILNVYKPKDIGSFDVVRRFKKFLGKKYGKLGHFGTLDPFAEGVLMIGFGQAARLNDFVHELMPKVYLAKGILGVHTETGDMTSEITNQDETEYLKNVISKFEIDFINKKLNEHFIGEYWQAPHKYSAAKYEGRKLHEWARDGVEIKKEKKLRHVLKIEVTRYQFPYLDIRFEVSSGTYIRTLFADCANYLGTIGVLNELIREQVGHIKVEDALQIEEWPIDDNFEIDKYLIEPIDLLPINSIKANEFQVRLIANGQKLDLDKHTNLNFDGTYVYVLDENDRLITLAKKENNLLIAQINFNL